MRTVAEYQSILRPLLRLMARKTELVCDPPFADLLERHPRIILALSHSTPLSWLPTIALLAVEFNDHGGAKRVPVGVMDRVFFRMPIIREIAQMITQTRESLSYFELSDRFERGGLFDLVVFPEGSNCFFGRPDAIQEFRSSKFLDLALRTKTPIVIGVQHGSEAWAKALDVPSEIVSRLDLLPQFVFNFVEKRIKKTGLFVLPLLPTSMERFQVRLELYRPHLQASQLSADPAERARQLREEGERVRLRMREMLVELQSDAKFSSSRQVAQRASVHRSGRRAGHDRARPSRADSMSDAVVARQEPSAPPDMGAPTIEPPSPTI